MKTPFRKLSLFIILSFVILGVSFLNISMNETSAASDIEITVNSEEHTVISPFEKSFRLVINVENLDTVSHRVNASPPEDEPPGGHVLAPVGYYDLAPGQEVEIVVVIEFNPGPGGQEDQTFDFAMDFSWEGGEDQVTAEVKMSTLELDNSANKTTTTLNVSDKSTDEPITNYFVITTFQSGMESYNEICNDSNGTCDIDTLSGDYLEEVSKEYSIDHKYEGWILQVSSPGYKSYFDTNFLPEENGEIDISLEPLTKVGEYTLSKSIETDFSIWWIKASENEDYFAFSQGTHGSPEFDTPSSTLVTMTDDSGELIWQNETGGECWGLDISPDGNYVSAACFDGHVYVWDKDGYLYLEHNTEFAFGRWVKFSPDSKYLMTGPVDNTPEKVGLFDLTTKEMLYSLDIGSYLREARFSDDGEIIYLASANGQMFAINTDDGELIWAGSGGYYIPFILGSSISQDTLVTSGKGRSFRALNLLTGKKVWETAVDQTITAGEVAEDGSVVGNTVGGMAYGLDPDGEITWARNYGGVGHNAVFYTRNGTYALFGGPNPTLFDADGNVLWQRDPGVEVQMSGPVEMDTGAAYVSWVSGDGTLLILGGDDGNIDFYEGEVKSGTNSYSQFTGTGKGINIDSPSGTNSPMDKTSSSPILFTILIIGGIVVVVTIVIVVVIVRKKKKKEISK